MADLNEIEEFNLRRTAIQNIITWSFEMWRRERQAQWEGEMTDAELDLRAKLEGDLLKEREALDKDQHTAKVRLREKQTRLADAISTAQQEASVTEKLMAAVQEAHEKAKDEYDKATEGIKASLERRRSLILQKLAGAQARTAEMEQRAQFFKAQWVSEEERLKREIATLDERRREIISNNGEKTRRALEDLRIKLQDVQGEIRELELAKVELAEQYQRALRLEAQFAARNRM
ncbi:hypothetical protein GL50803_0011925 [Giardia duodenalis]|uniref:Uncharacterized protein n=1 Tax=Giardia intestinalis (strain ATCC 50803 / WB clone C6) TaxID=184922 RepID=A8B4R9_GIAIC|nr:hypothetical protein GL50803_0011925 [Giardia intestinalis]KAE8303748.1 hypothetical protein GL50803_0011925 [Giardia intestinalis]|eukprot:XP_001709676.1 Hypothetical protein GL50803_11925 [Giardia lamblia ATCC 50803]